MNFTLDCNTVAYGAHKDFQGAEIGGIKIGCRIVSEACFLAKTSHGFG